MIESLKKTYDFLQDCNFPINKLLEGPKSGSENNILEYVKDNITIAWHALGTVKMGIKGGEGACVCSNFNVLENLQVIDLSMCLVVPSNHTQSTVYLIGETTAIKIIEEYKLGTDAAI